MERHNKRMKTFERHKVMKTFAKDNINCYFELIVELLVIINIPDLNNVEKNILESEIDEDEFFRNIADQNYHKNVITEITKSICKCESLYNSFKLLILEKIYINLLYCNCNCNHYQSNHDYNESDRKNKYNEVVHVLKNYILENNNTQTPTGEFFSTIINLIKRYNEFFFHIDAIQNTCSQFYVRKL